MCCLEICLVLYHSQPFATTKDVLSPSKGRIPPEALMLRLKVKGLRPEALSTRGKEAKYQKKHKNQSTSPQEQREEQISRAESKVFSAWLSKISTITNVMGTSAKPQHLRNAAEFSSTTSMVQKVLCQSNSAAKTPSPLQRGQELQRSASMHAVILICSLYICK